MIDSLLLGIVQGLTEFLPISSSGHLILMRELLGINTSGGLAFDAILQLATALAVIVYFRKDVLSLLREALLVIAGRSKNGSRENQKLLIALVAGTIPAVAMGVLLEEMMETIFRSASLVAVMLIAGSALFIAAEKLAKQLTSSPSVLNGWWIGWFQTLALIPGVSRSGATISGGLLLGLTRESAARFSFLLSIPIIVGSGLKKLLEVLRGTVPDVAIAPLLVGSVAAFLIGLACIHFLLAYLKRHTLYAFVWYRVVLAILVLFFVKEG